MTVWSLTPAFNEVEVFDIRLAELDPIVDIHVIAEAPWTYKGTSKPLHFTDAIESGRWDAFKDKLRVIVVEDEPSQDNNVFQPFGDPERWRRENWQRAALSRGLDGLEPDDIVIISDLDEIPRASTILKYQLENIQHMVRPHLPMHVGMLNWRWYFALGVILRVFRGRELTSGVHTPESIRQSPHHEEWSVPNWPLYVEPLAQHTFDLGRYGWHLAYMGGVKAMQYKIREAAHPELERPENTNTHHLKKCLRDGVDIFNRHDRPSYWVPDAMLPDYVQTNLDKFEDWLCEEPFQPAGDPSGPLQPGYYWQPANVPTWSPTQ